LIPVQSRQAVAPKLGAKPVAQVTRVNAPLVAVQVRALAGHATQALVVASITYFLVVPVVGASLQVEHYASKTASAAEVATVHHLT